MKDTPISLFPQFPDNESWYELSCFVRDRNFVGTGPPISDCVDGAIVFSYGSSHEMGGPIPYFLIEWIVI